jgi:hypothetical protein
VTLRLTLVSLAVGAIVVVVAATTSLTLDRAALLAPVLVIGIGAVAGLIVFWGRVAAQNLREVRRPKLVVGAALGFVGLLVVLTLLGVNLPHE